MNAATPAVQRALVFIGRGANGLLPVVLTAIAARLAGLAATGRFAATLALALALAELADISSQRHVARSVASGTDDLQGRVAPTDLGGYFGLRWALVALGLPIAFLLVPPDSRASPSVWALAAAPLTLAVNTGYAVALRDRRDVWLAVGPIAAIASAVAVAWVSARGAVLDLEWAPVVGLVFGRSVELMTLRGVLEWPRASFAPRHLREAWRQVRYLLYQGALSAAQARLVLPLAAWLAGSAAAGMLSIGLALLSVVSLVSLAVGLPAFRSVTFDAASRTPARALRALRPALSGTLALAAVLSALLVLATPFVLTNAFRLSAPSLGPAVRIIAGTGVLEALCLFAGLAYQASFSDRQLFRLSVVTASQTWAAIALGAWVGGLVPLAMVYAVGRTVGTATLFVPFWRGRHDL